VPLRNDIIVPKVETIFDEEKRFNTHFSYDKCNILPFDMKQKLIQSYIREANNFFDIFIFSLDCTFDIED